MVAWMVALISWRLWGTMEMCVPRELKATPRKIASNLQIHRGIIWHTFVVPNFAVPNFASSLPRYFERFGVDTMFTASYVIVPGRCVIIDKDALPFRCYATVRRNTWKWAHGS